TLDVSSEDFNDLPESLTVTIEVTQNVPVRLQLQRISDINSNLPVYLVSKDSNGNIQKQKQEPSDLKTVGYYQDVNMQANIKITLTEGDKKQAILEGEFRYQGKVYSIKPFSRAKRDTGDTVYDVHEKQTQRHFGHKDYIPLADKSSKFIKRSTSYSTRRHERATTPTYYIDVVAAVDKTMYDIFLTRAGNQQAVSTDIREYFSFVFNGVDLSYRSITWTSYRINVRLIKIVVFSKTDVYRVIFDAKKEAFIESNLSLDSFSQLVNSATGMDLFAPYDHVMLFVGKSMISDDDKLLGLAYMSHVCRTDGQSSSIIYDAGTYSSILTAAHELGHSLSAEHDGEGNRCRFEDRYIMAATDSDSTQGTELHPWIFSNCSVANFTNLFQELLQTSHGKMCLNTKLSADDSYDVKSYLGQRYPPDQQCKRRLDKTDVVFSRNLHDTDLCLNLYCSFADSTSYYSQSEPAYYGTSCASGKVCKQGECVADPAAPIGDDYCMFGENFSGCASLVKRFTGNCYNATYRHVCCQTCQSAYQTVEGCEFGDKRENCTLSDCNRSDPKFAEECCGTCHYGTTFTTTASPTKTTTIDCSGDTRQNCTDSVCTSTNSTAVMECCVTCGLVTLTPTTIVPTCQDDPQFKSRNGNCLTSVWLSASACYNQTIQRSCCASCASADVGTTGCVYGDKKIGCDKQSCKTSKSDCCETCEGFNKVTQLHGNVFILTVIFTSYLL
ncbi:ADAM family mig-17, partial [Biomphalaria pfeifferi]